MKKNYLIMLAFVMGLIPAVVFSFDLGKVIQEEVGKVVHDVAENLQAKLRDEFPIVKHPKIAQHLNLYGDDVTVFGYEGCPYCRKTYSFLNRNNIPYKLMDVEKDSAAKAEFQRQGFSGVPQIIIKKEKLSGYDATQLSTVLRRNDLMK